MPDEYEFNHVHAEHKVDGRWNDDSYNGYGKGLPRDWDEFAEFNQDWHKRQTNEYEGHLSRLAVFVRELCDLAGPGIPLESYMRRGWAPHGGAEMWIALRDRDFEPAMKWLAQSTYRHTPKTRSEIRDCRARYVWDLYTYERWYSLVELANVVDRLGQVFGMDGYVMKDIISGRRGKAFDEAEVRFLVRNSTFAKQVLASRATTSGAVINVSQLAQALTLTEAQVATLEVLLSASSGTLSVRSDR